MWYCDRRDRVDEWVVDEMWGFLSIVEGALSDVG
jgi:hypothetical protein